MTNINCSSDCVYQKEGKCCFENVTLATVCGNDKCVYYAPSASSQILKENVEK